MRKKSDVINLSEVIVPELNTPVALFCYVEGRLKVISWSNYFLLKSKITKRIFLCDMIFYESITKAETEEGDKTDNYNDIIDELLTTLL